MKALLAIIPALALAACSGYPYTVKDGGDGVYYAESPPIYTYVDGYFGFPYYGPYSWSWYHPVWYSPYPTPHYSWYRPYYHWSHPFPGYPARFAAYDPKPGVLEPTNRRSPARGVYPVLPADLRSATVGSTLPRYSLKSATYSNPTVKGRMASKYSKPTYSRPSMTSSPSYRSTPRASSRTSTRPPSSSRSAPRHIQ